MAKTNKILSMFLILMTCSLAGAHEIDCNTAQMQAMDKITGRVNLIEVPINTEVEFGTFSIVIRSCKSRSPEETPENFAFVDIADKPLKEEPVNIFKGWMLSSNPAINPVEHPIYDIWLLKCVNKDIDETVQMSEEELAARDKLPSIQEIPVTTKTNFIDDIVESQADDAAINTTSPKIIQEIPLPDLPEEDISDIENTISLEVSDEQ